MTEDEMVGWHHRLNGHEFGSTPGVGDGQGGLACCGSWGCTELAEREPEKRLPHPRKAAGAQITHSRPGEVVTKN